MSKIVLENSTNGEIALCSMFERNLASPSQRERFEVCAGLRSAAAHPTDRNHPAHLL
jgi:hypothetical protein